MRRRARSNARAGALQLQLGAHRLGAEVPLRQRVQRAVALRMDPPPGVTEIDREPTPTRRMHHDVGGPSDAVDRDRQSIALGMILAEPQRERLLFELTRRMTVPVL